MPGSAAGHFLRLLTVVLVVDNVAALAGRVISKHYLFFIAYRIPIENPTTIDKLCRNFFFALFAF